MSTLTITIQHGAGSSNQGKRQEKASKIKQNKKYSGGLFFLFAVTTLFYEVTTDTELAKAELWV
jgi:hypothetical protein